MTAPGELCRRGEVPASPGYAVFDCEMTGTDPERDEIVSLALVLLDPDGNETLRFGSLIRPSRPIPEEASAIHGIRDTDVSDAPTFAELAGNLLELLGARIFVAHNASFHLTMLRSALRIAGVEYRPPAVACTLDAFRVLEPLAKEHRLEAICARQGVPLAGPHDAMHDAEATVPRPQSCAGISATRSRCLHAGANPRRYPPGLRTTNPPRLRPPHRFRRPRRPREGLRAHPPRRRHRRA